GSIVNISTFGAIEPTLDFPISSAIRAGLAGYVKMFSQQYGPMDIRMNNVLPGYIDSYEVNSSMVDNIPLQRPGKTAEIAKTVKFLLSEDSGYISGQSITVDGGLTKSI
ncbi:MAG: SDR family oxidoreductase, partial [Bacteroidetes bacterium]|nr:SDR family oxidoreductase [Bacteroidota bacterium]